MEKDSSGKKRKIDIKLLFGLFLVLVAVVLLVLFLTQGETTVTGGFPNNEKSVSMTCGSTAIKYPFFIEDNPTRKVLEVKIVASGDRVDKIGLVYQLYFNSENAIKESRDRNHYEMNRLFGEDKLEADALGAMYSKMSDSFKFSLFAESEELDKTTAKYFMLDDTSDIKYSTLKKYYQTKGFTCTDFQ